MIPLWWKPLGLSSSEVTWLWTDSLYDLPCFQLIYVTLFSSITACSCGMSAPQLSVTSQWKTSSLTPEESPQLLRSTTSSSRDTNMLPRKKLEHSQNLHLWSVHLIAPHFLPAFDDRVLQILYLSPRGLSWWRVSVTTTSSHLDNGICGQNLCWEFEELMKDISQGQMKVDPPKNSTAVDTREKEWMTEKRK